MSLMRRTTISTCTHQVIPLTMFNDLEKFQRQYTNNKPRDQKECSTTKQFQIFPSKTFIILPLSLSPLLPRAAPKIQEPNKTKAPRPAGTLPTTFHSHKIKSISPPPSPADSTINGPARFDWRREENKGKELSEIQLTKFLKIIIILSVYGSPVTRIAFLPFAYIIACGHQHNRSRMQQQSNSNVITLDIPASLPIPISCVFSLSGQRMGRDASSSFNNNCHNFRNHKSHSEIPSNCSPSFPGPFQPLWLIVLLWYFATKSFLTTCQLYSSHSFRVLWTPAGNLCCCFCSSRFIPINSLLQWHKNLTSLGVARIRYNLSIQFQDRSTGMSVRLWTWSYS